MSQYPPLRRFWVIISESWNTFVTQLQREKFLSVLQKIWIQALQVDTPRAKYFEPQMFVFLHFRIFTYTLLVETPLIPKYKIGNTPKSEILNYYIVPQSFWFWIRGIQSAYFSVSACLFFACCNIYFDRHSFLLLKNLPCCFFFFPKICLKSEEWEVNWFHLLLHWLNAPPPTVRAGPEGPTVGDWESTQDPHASGGNWRSAFHYLPVLVSHKLDHKWRIWDLEPASHRNAVLS